MGEHVLLHVALGGKSTVTDVALEGALLGMAAVVDLEGRVAGKGLEADVARCVSPRF